MHNQNRLTNKVALITGAASGIGAAIGKLFHEQGATVILTDIDDKMGQALADQLGVNASYYHLDVSQESEWQALTQRIKSTHEALDILVNNAGICNAPKGKGPTDPENLNMEAWSLINKINSDGVALGCKYGIALMKEKGGSIVNMSSRSGIVGVPTLAPYAASKAAVRNHTKTVALYCGQQGYNIRCNSLHPAAILTPIWEAMLGTGAEREKAIEAVTAGIPIGRMGVSDDVAFAALYFASDESSFITGAELVIDGGILAGAGSAPKSTHH